MTGDTEQLGELTQLYSSYGEAELVALGKTFGDLTDSAQQALKAEFTRRGLSLPSASAMGKQRSADSEASALEGFATDAPEDFTFEFSAVEDAMMAQTALKSAGIESLLPSSEMVGVDTPRLIVAPSDAQAAELILARPNALGSVTEEEALFPHATCPQCGTPDPVLESIEPTNQWRCEACSHTWRDSQFA